MDEETGKTIYEYTCMCPPGEIKYFFTSNKYSYFARDHKICKERLEIPEIQVYNSKKEFTLNKHNYRIINQAPVLDRYYGSLLKE